MSLPEVIIVGKASDFIKFNYFVMADFTTTERTTEHYVSHNTTTDSNSTKERMWESAIPPAMQFGFGVIGNIIALVVLVMSSKTHKWRPFYRLVGGLAVTDGGGILLVYPTVMVRYATDFTYLFPKALCNYSSFVYTFTLISSAMIVCAMSLDRYVAILHPFLYGSGKNGRRANVTLCIVWTAGAVISGLQLVGLGSSFNYYPKSWCFINFVEMNTLDRVNSYIYSITASTSDPGGQHHGDRLCPQKHEVGHQELQTSPKERHLHHLLSPCHRPNLQLLLGAVNGEN